MTIKMRSILAFRLMVFMIAGSVAQGTEMPLGHCGLRLQVPTDWIFTDKAKLKPPVCFQAISKDKVFSVMVLQSQEARSGCAEFMRSMDASRKLKNQLSEKEQKLSKEVIEKMSVQEAIRGEYLIQGPQMKFPVRQESLCLQKKGELRLIQWAYQQRNKEIHQPIVQKSQAELSWP